MDRHRISSDDAIEAFVHANVTSFPAWDLVLFLNANPRSDATMPELCAALARSEREVDPVVRGLAETGLVDIHGSPDGQTRYRLTSDPATRTLLARFIEMTNAREVRLKVVRHVMSQVIG